MKRKLSQSVDSVQIELSGTILAQLIQSGMLHGSECKCLNNNAKKVLWQSLLDSSLHNEGQLCQ